MCRYHFNKYRSEKIEESSFEIEYPDAQDVYQFHKSLDEYQPTVLHSLSGLAHELDLAQIYIKDESQRFGLNAFKVLGASYALYRLIKQRWEQHTGTHLSAEKLFDESVRDAIGEMTFCTATDGNHGRAVAWAVRKLGQKAVIYIPACSAKSRVENIRKEMARVMLVEGSYDNAVARAAADADQNGWQMLSDNAYDKETVIPQWVMAGYTTIFREIDDVIQPGDRAPYDHVFVQAGVGTLAACAAWYMRMKYKDQLKLICVEPLEADCMLASIRSSNGELSNSEGNLTTIMAGLNCGRPSLTAWPLVRAAYDLFLAVPDDYVREAMRRLYHPVGDDRQVISGESGAAGLAALIALMTSKSLREVRSRLGINSESRVLLINTEGDTDPEAFRTIVKSK